MKRPKPDAPRAWQRMLSGRRLDLLDPSPLDVEIEDIAHGLSRVARWNGQTEGRWPYSVAEHSILVENLAHRLYPEMSLKWRLATLLHDAPEYVVGDMITPFKAVIGPDYKSVEKRLEEAVHLRFGLPAALPQEVTRKIKRADRIAAYLEATQLAGFTLSEANKIFGKPKAGIELVIEPLSPTAAKQAYLKRFRILGGPAGRPE
ncbi:HD family hydrolase [Nisaea acidiphila]|uniref:HD family hydrolase n=1 Tax=Nisaea acidiphila TaxID=1862145 RepID=A0A9J7AS83_9PROT|nr:HD family hydrolase [Nisaea acidiphila]UUX49730.1 HD family hydrolase [Nisaea acidiphila]